MAADPPSDETLSQLTPAVYGEFRQLTRYYVGRERAPQTIQATALVHEAYLRLAKDGKHNWQGRGHFKAIAAIAMRRILVELRFFGGLTVDETAEVLSVSPATVKRGWAVARAWLLQELDKGRAGGS